MKVTRSSIMKNWIVIGLILVVGFSIIAGYISVNGIKNANQTSESFKQFYLEENKSEIKQRVMNEVEAIKYEKSLIENREMEVVKHEITHLAYILESMNISEFDNLNEAKSVAVLNFEKMVEIDEEHLYFAVDSSGNLLRSGIDEAIEGVNLYDAQDENGVYYVREILKAKDFEEGVYATYLWPKVKGGPALDKTAYCYYMPTYDIVIGSGVYHEDIDQYLQESIYNRLQIYYENKDSYIFVSSYEGIGLVQANPDYVGKDVSGTLNHDGRLVHDMFLQAASHEEGGFVTYSYYKKGEDQLTEKISYVAPLEGWDAYIGMGFYTEDLNEVYEAYDQEFKRQHYNEVFYVVVGLILLSFIVLLLLMRGNRLQTAYMQQEEIVFTELFKHVTEGIVIVGDNSVLYSNEKAGKYLTNTIEKYVESDRLVLPKTDKGTFELENESGDIFYVELNEKSIQYKGTDSTIYFLKNVTSTYLKVDEYHKISLVDDMTGLANRRALFDDFSKQGDDLKGVIGVIDLDNFKQVNDTYGHGRGDEVLFEVASVFNNRLRRYDKFYRYGGEEFIIVMNEVTLDKASTILEELNETLKTTCQSKFDIIQTFSAGIVQIEALETPDVNNLISEADKLLYKAKENGKSRVEF